MKGGTGLHRSGPWAPSFPCCAPLLLQAVQVLHAWDLLPCLSSKAFAGIIHPMEKLQHRLHKRPKRKRGKDPEEKGVQERKSLF